MEKQIIEVTNATLARDFLLMPNEIYKNDKQYIRPFDNDINDVFDSTKNNAFKDGEVKRWLLIQNNQIIGRIAAFTSEKNYAKMEQKTGGIGFFECINDQQSANMLLDTAKFWLEFKGCEAMDGPNNFGEKDKWWGMLVDGFFSPTYGMNYNPLYYNSLFKNYGFEVYYHQYVYAKSTLKDTAVPKRTQKKWDMIKQNSDYTFSHIVGNDLNKYAKDFCDVYNAAWGKSFRGFKPMSLQQAQKIMKAMKPIMDKKLMWFGYYKNEAVAMFISIPDINEIIKYLNGKLNILGKIFFFIRLKFAKPKTAVGIVFGVSPEHQGTGLDGAIQGVASQYYYSSSYDKIEMTWIGEFNPRMINMVKGLECELYKTYATYRYLFDRNKQFTKHPILN
jgi:hypothetical protein